MIGGGLVDNPFAAARFAPGVIPWLSEEPLSTLADRALARGAQHQVIGPHGSGKSTLLAHLERVARRSGSTALHVRGSRGVPHRAFVGRPRVLLVDEAEELPRGALLLLRLAARVTNAALVVTTHEDLGLPTILATRIDAALAARVVAHLSPRGATPSDLPTRLERHAGNMRELLFELYDEAELGVFG